MKKAISRFVPIGNVLWKNLKIRTAIDEHILHNNEGNHMLPQVYKNTGVGKMNNI
jgi:hypothetical protein